MPTSTALLSITLSIKDSKPRCGDWTPRDVASNAMPALGGWIVRHAPIAANVSAKAAMLAKIGAASDADT